jgi:hypothetical protein
MTKQPKPKQVDYNQAEAALRAASDKLLDAWGSADAVQKSSIMTLLTTISHQYLAIKKKAGTPLTYQSLTSEFKDAAKSIKKLSQDATSLTHDINEATAIATSLAGILPLLALI